MNPFPENLYDDNLPKFSADDIKQHNSMLATIVEEVSKLAFPIRLSLMPIKASHTAAALAKTLEPGGFTVKFRDSNNNAFPVHLIENPSDYFICISRKHS